MVTIWRDWLTPEVLAIYHPNERLSQAVKHVKAKGSINNAQYRDMTKVSESTALRELRKLTNFGILTRVGGTGQSVYYAIAKAKRDFRNQRGNRS